MRAPAAAALGLAMATWLAATAPVRAAPACQGLDPIEPTVKVTTERPGAPRIVNASDAEIRRAARRVGRHDARSLRQTRGLTTNQIEGRAGYTLAQVSRPGRGTCVALRSIEGRLANTEVAILVDRRYPEGSCERSVILEHEREHVRINREALEQGQKELRARLEDVAADWQGRWVPAGQARRIDAAVEDAVGTAVESIRTEAARRHAEIDTPAAYAATQRRCRDW